MLSIVCCCSYVLRKSKRKIQRATSRRGFAAAVRGTWYGTWYLALRCAVRQRQFYLLLLRSTGTTTNSSSSLAFRIPKKKVEVEQTMMKLRISENDAQSFNILEVELHHPSSLYNYNV